MPRSSSESIRRGIEQFNWAKSHMSALTLAQDYVLKHSGKKLLADIEIGLCLHISKETSVLVTFLQALGMHADVVAANPLSTRISVADYLRSIGVRVRGSESETEKKYTSDIRDLASSGPQIIVDDGGELHVAYSRLGLNSCVGGTDETTTGTVRLISLEKAGMLRYPVIPVNEGKSKHLIDNRYGTGQSSLDGILRATGLLIAGRVVVIAGYGWVGKGVAQRAKGMGARVIVTEVDPIASLEAHLDGFEVKKMRDAAREGQIFLTCTGQIGVLDRKAMEAMPDGSIIANCGHFNKEIDVQSLKLNSRYHRRINQYVTEYKLRGKSIYLLCEGRVVNLVAAEGHPPEVMQLSFADQLLSIFYLIKNKEKLRTQPMKVLAFPREIDEMVANFAIRAFGLRIDKLSEKQKKYSKNFGI